MKKWIRAAALAAVAVCGVQVVHLASYDDREPPPGRPSTSNPRSTMQLAVGKPISIDLAAEAGGLEDLTPRELRDQQLDWLLFASVWGLGKTADEFNLIFFDTPMLRQGYMRPVGSFEFGTTRSRTIDDGTVLALVAAGTSAAQRKDDLAQVADLQRKNLGKPFKRMVVVEYAIDGSQAKLVRQDDVAYDALFSPSYGYQQKVVKSLADLQDFMKAADDLSSVTVQPDGVLAGGRKMAAAPYRAITVEHIATVWQAEKELAQLRQEWEQVRDGMVEAFNAQWRGRKFRADEMAAAQLQHDQEEAALQRQLQEEVRQRGVKGGTGFSLDPETDYEALAATLSGPLGELFVARGLNREQLDRIVAGLRMSQLDAYLELIGTSRKNGNPGLAGFLLKLMHEKSFQMARYDGNLQGTEVGMVLFYTDLLAKLWTIDFADTSPRRMAIVDFLDDPSVSISRAYDAERRALPDARLWFGPSNLGMQLGAGKNEMLFARTATRIFSAGSNPEEPGKETQTSAFLAAGIDWWNDHYEEVAAHEQEYQRLNAIMKWSAVIAWLGETGQQDRLSFLAAVKVDRSARFPEWARSHPQLRFSKWDQVGFHPAGYKGRATEALPRLYGPVTAGGVSLASREVAKREALSHTVSDLVKRSNLDYAQIGDKLAFTTLEKTSFVVKQGAGTTHVITANAAPATKLRGTGAQLAQAPIERSARVQGNALILDTAAGDVPLGRVAIESTPNGFSVGWKARELAQAQGLARGLSRTGDSQRRLLADPSVERIVELSETDFVVKLKDSQRWVRLGKEAEARVDIDPQWQLRAAYPGRLSDRVMQAAVKDEGALGGLMPSGQHLVAEPGDGAKLLLKAVADDATPTGRFVQIENGAVRMEGWLDSRGRLHLRASNGADPVVAAATLKPTDIALIRDAIDKSRPVARLGDSDPLVRALEKGDYASTAAQISRDPKAARDSLDALLARDLAQHARLHARSGLAETLNHLDALIAVHGQRPDLLMRRGLVQIRRGNVDAALASLQEPRRGLTNRTAFFDEINALRRSALDPGDDIGRYAHMADYHEAQVLGVRTPYVAEPRIYGNRLDFDLRLQSMADDVVPVEQLQSVGVGIVYRQKSASLDRVDWSAPMDQALSQVVTAGLGKVVRVPRGRVADYRPAAIWSPDHQREFVPTQRGGRPNIPSAALRPYQACTTSSDPEACFRRDSREPSDQQAVYLVVGA